MRAHRKEKQILFIHMMTLEVFFYIQRVLKIISSNIRQLLSRQKQKQGTELGYSHVSRHTHKAVIN